VRPLRGRAVTLKWQQATKNLTLEGADKAAETLNSSYLTAHSLNNFVEAEDVLFLRRRQLQLNNAARLMGLKKRAAQAGK
jgi:hypothetical protein